MVRACGTSCKLRAPMKSVVRASVRVATGVFVVGACAVFATACLEGDPIPADVIQRSEAVLLEGATGGARFLPVVRPRQLGRARLLLPHRLPPVAVNPLAPGSGFQDNGLPPVLPEVNELGEELDEQAIPENAIPLDEFLRVTPEFSSV